MKTLNQPAPAEVSPPPAPLGGFDIGRVIQTLRQHYDRPMTVPSLARECGMSVRTLYRLYHSATGTTVARDLTRLRLEAAAELLREPGLKLEPIAMRTGFGNAKNLCRRFKDHFGLTPGQWRASATTRPSPSPDRFTRTPHYACS